MAIIRFERSHGNKKQRYLVLLFLIISLAYYVFNFVDKKDPFAVKFCDANGTCHEKPDKPSPRTVYSAWNKDQYEKWWSFHTYLNGTCDEYIKKRKKISDDSEKKQSLVLLGDSITESWRGTGLGKTSARAKGVPQVLLDKFHDDYDPIILAIGGDQTQHLLYRMENGQLPSSDEQSAIYVVMIGTNNLGSGELPGPTATGVLAVADYILGHTKGQLLLFHVLPRGDTKALKGLCPPRCSSSGKPFKSFIPAVNKLNNFVDEGVKNLKEQYGADRLGMIECSSKFIAVDSDTGVDQNLMPDLLHPNAAGHVFLADCILDYLSKNRDR